MDTTNPEILNELPPLKPVKKKLTWKEQLFVRKFVETGSLTAAAAYAYDCSNTNSASAMGSQIYAKPHIQGAVAREFRKEDMDEKWVLMGFKRHAEQKVDRSVSLRAYELTAKYLGMLKDINIINRTNEPKAITSVAQCKEVINRSLDELNRLQAEYGSAIPVLSGEGMSGIHDSTEKPAPADLSVPNGMENQNEEIIAIAEGIIKDKSWDNKFVNSGDTKKSEHKDIDSLGNTGSVNPYPAGNQVPL